MTWTVGVKAHAHAQVPTLHVMSNLSAAPTLTARGRRSAAHRLWTRAQHRRLLKTQVTHTRSHTRARDINQPAETKMQTHLRFSFCRSARKGCRTCWKPQHKTAERMHESRKKKQQQLTNRPVRNQSLEFCPVKPQSCTSGSREENTWRLQQQYSQWGGSPVIRARFLLELRLSERMGGDGRTSSPSSSWVSRRSDGLLWGGTRVWRHNTDWRQTTQFSGLFFFLFFFFSLFSFITCCCTSQADSWTSSWNN